MSRLEKLGAAFREVLAADVGEVGEGRVVVDPGARSDNPYPRDMPDCISREGLGSSHAVGKLVAGLRGRNEEIPAARRAGAPRINALRAGVRHLDLRANEDRIPQRYQTGDGPGDGQALKTNVKTGAEALFQQLAAIVEKVAQVPGAYQEHMRRLGPMPGMGVGGGPGGMGLGGSPGMMQEGAECPHHGDDCPRGCPYREKARRKLREIEEREHRELGVKDEAEEEALKRRLDKGAALREVLAQAIAAGPRPPTRSAPATPSKPPVSQVPPGVARMPMGGPSRMP